MMKMCKILWISTALLGLLGCDMERPQIEKHTTIYQEICVAGVIYLRSPNGNLTPKINADYSPYTCQIKEQHHG